MSLLDEDERSSVPDWVLTYGDMMSLLLCFFILLGMAEIKQNKYEAMSNRSVAASGKMPRRKVRSPHWMKGRGSVHFEVKPRLSRGG